MARIESRGPIGIVGLGLMGGSLAKAIRARFPRRALIGVERNTTARRQASRSGLFETVSANAGEELSRCQIVVLCVPVPQILRLLGPVSRRMREGAVLTDVGAVREPAAREAKRSVRRGVLFVGAHPMFGGEGGGFRASRSDLWKAGTVAICGGRAPAWAVQKVAKLHGALGARVVFCSPAAHDSAVAAVSHLPYLVASALALCGRASGPLARRLAGRGFLDTTRVASFAYRVQGEAAGANRFLAPALRRFERELDRLQLSLASSGGKASFASARRARLMLARRISKR